MYDAYKRRKKIIQGKLSWNKRLPEGSRRSVEEIETEVDRIMAEAPRIEREQEILRKSRDRALYYEWRERWLLELRECKAVEEAISCSAELADSWIQNGDLHGEARAVYDECRELDDGNEGIYRRHLCRFDLIERLASAGLLASMGARDESKEIAYKLLIDELRDTGFDHWAEAIETGDFTLVIRGFPEKVPADL